ncbi:MAG: hypothetical protein L3J70_11500 [Gammaproteobacteria bacterium]|nr:hypothetical protein [Gammaproteobacteria bacterium]
MFNNLLVEGDLTLDVEFGNSYNFFSASKNNSPQDYDYNEKLSINAMIPAAKFEITDSVAFKGAQGTRDLSFLALEKNYLFDAVSRFVVYSRNNRPAYIDNQKIGHNNSNFYYQYHHAKPQVPIGDDGWITFEDNFSNLPAGFDNVFYIRDEANTEKGYRWIIHHRCIAKIESANLIVRGCHPRFNKPFKFQSLWPKWLKRKLYRVRERDYPFFPIQSVGEVCIPGNTKISLRTKIQVINERSN